MDPGRFRGDRLLRTQPVRRVRGLTTANSTDYRDRDRQGAENLHARAWSLKSADVMGSWLTETFFKVLGDEPGGAP